MKAAKSKKPKLRPTLEASGSIGSDRADILRGAQKKKNAGSARGSNRGSNRGSSKKSLNNKAVKPSVLTVLDQYTDYCTNMGVDGFRRLYNDRLARFIPQGTWRAWEKHKDKNRYPDVACLDQTRVVLKLDVPPFTDYIHANRVQIPNHDRVFIATQAPMENTKNDFWRMVVQEQSMIIMVVDGKFKCAQYWPLQPKQNISYGKIIVINKKVESGKHHESDVYTLEVLQEGCSNSLIVKLIHFYGWSDNALPDSDMCLLRLIKLMAEADTLASGPVIMHCSAGVSRTGCVILIDVIINRLFKEIVIESDQLITIFQKIRSCRISAIQKECQLIFAIFSTLEYIKSKTSSEKLNARVDKFKQEFKASKME